MIRKRNLPLGAEIVDGLIVDHERAIRVLEGRMRGQNRVVRLDHGSGHLRSRIHGELELRLLSVIDGKALHEQRGEAAASAATERVEDHEALETGAVVRKLSDAVENAVDDLLADRVMTAGVVVRRVFLKNVE